MSASLAPGEEMTAKNSKSQYTITRKEILGTLRNARDEVNITATRGRKGEVTDEEESASWQGWQDTIRAADIDEAVTEVANKGWLNSDWYRSIEFLREKGIDENDELDNGGDEDDRSTAAAVQIRKADTMLQEKFDYLSERRRADYRQWKAGILLRLEALEREQAEQVGP